MARRILVTSALPYANGPIHLGHLVEHIQTDVWVRFQRLRGHEVLYVCADDAHGTPTMVAARARGVSPEELIGPMREAHQRDFQAFGISHDNYYTTHSDENRELSALFYERLREGGHIAEREVDQLYCEQDGMFLPDRFVRTTCPRCGAREQYGDSCDACGATYDPMELPDPRCSLCGTKPVPRSSQHHFIKLGDFEPQLRAWVAGEHVRPEVRNKLDEWFQQGLRDWDISRDAPYFGFEIPGAPGKYFYVWLDAPIGYMASTLDWCKRSGRDFDDWWKSPDTEIHHFIGKDILYFHTLFWPAMLMAAGFQTPHRVHVHGFLTVNGEKMSKSRGTFITVESYLAQLEPEHLRYYLAAKLGPTLSDMDLSFDDFTARVNADLVGNLVNLGSRSIKMAGRHFEGRLAEPNAEGRALLDRLRAAAPELADHYEHLQFGHALRAIAALGDEVNRYLETSKPWEAVKTDKPAAHAVLSSAVSAFRILVLYLKPVLPALAEAAEAVLKLAPQTWDDHGRDLSGHTVGEFRHLMQRVDPEKIEALLADGQRGS